MWWDPQRAELEEALYELVFETPPPEWLEDKDPIEGLELLAAIVEVNARYFFDSANVTRLKAAGSRIQKVIESYGGATSTNSSLTNTPTGT